MILDTSAVVAILLKESGCGDCLSYAVARLANEPLLFVGEDFARTDVARP